MIDLERQLQQYVDAGFQHVSAIDAADVFGADRSRSTRHRRWLVPVGAAVVLALVATVVVVVDRGGSGSSIGAGSRREVGSVDTDPAPTIAGEWTVDLGGEIPYAPVVVDGSVVVVTTADDFSQSSVLALELAGSEVDPQVAARRWSVDLGAPVVAAPVAARGVVLVRLADDRIVALSAGNGAVRWSAPTGSGAVEAIGSPVVDHRGSSRTVFVGSPDGLLQALSLDSGRERWRTRLDGAVVAPPTPSGDELLVVTTALPVGSRPGRVYVLGPTGDVVDDYAIEQPVFEAPAGDPARVVVGGDEGSLLIGREVEHSFERWLARPVVTTEVIVALSADGAVRAYAADQPTRLLWSTELGANQGPELVLHGDTLIAVAGRIDALDPSSGASRWKVGAPEAFLGVSDDPNRIVAVSRGRGSLAVIDARDGSLVVDFALHDTPSGAELSGDTLVWTGSGGVVTTARLR